MDYKINAPTDGDEMIFRHADIFFSCFYNDENHCVHQSREHAMNYVYSGEMLIDDGNKITHVQKGECVFIRRDHRVTLTKKPLDGEQYCGIFLMFTRRFLREMFQRLPSDKALDNVPKVRSSVIKLPISMEIDSLFTSMTPYFNQKLQAQDDFMNLKLQEGLLALLHIDERFYPTLFDFNEPWKIDILEFMEQNYMYDFSMEDLATFTGRSLATFKRDFKKISTLTPQKWLIHKRLEAAYEKMKTGTRKVQDVYLEVGFKNQSHFATAFKKQFGVSPTAISQ